MTADVFLSALMFVVAGSFTPGPNNTMLLASGANFGFRRTLPHLLGITLGYAAMFTVIALGAGQAFTSNPMLYAAIRIASAAYLVWLAWRLASAEVKRNGDGAEDVEGAPLSFWQAVIFQWINPKGVGLAIAAAANFLHPARLATELPVMLALLLVMSFASGGTWTLFGQGLRGWLQHGKRQVLFNRAMAGALLISLWPLLAPVAP